MHSHEFEGTGIDVGKQDLITRVAAFASAKSTLDVCICQLRMIFCSFSVDVSKRNGETWVDGIKATSLVSRSPMYFLTKSMLRLVDGTIKSMQSHCT